jgi:hypothetical protein
MLRGNARLIPAAACANALSELGSRAMVQIEEILTATAGIAATVIRNPAASATLGAQLESNAQSNEDQIEEFIGRFDAIAARNLGQLAWLTVSSLPVHDLPNLESETEFKVT